MINSRKIEDLLPVVQTKVHAFIKKCNESGIDVLITSTYRDNESQTSLYNQGRTPESKARGEKKVTNAKAGQSYHNYAIAFDFVPLINGKAQWNNIALFNKCGVIAKSCGLEWAGDWKTFKELAHCQYSAGLTISELQAGKRPK